MPYKEYPYKITKQKGKKFYWTDYTIKRKEREANSLAACGRRLLTARYNYDINKLPISKLNKRFGYKFKKTDSKATVIRKMSKDMDMMFGIAVYIDKEVKAEKASKAKLRKNKTVTRRVRTRRI